MDIRKRIYVAGAYSADNVIQVLENIKRGNKVAAYFMKKGYAPFSPWLDYQFQFFQNLSFEDYYEYSIAWLLASDCMFVLSKYENSKGTLNEIEIAKENNIPVFFQSYKMFEYLKHDKCHK